MLKTLARDVLATKGYVVRHVGARSQVAGVDLLHDARVLLNTEAPLVFDVGANVGQTIKEVRATFQRPRIIAFEPSPKSRAALSAFEGVTVEKVALSDRQGIAQFYVSDEWPVNDSLLPSRESGASRCIHVETDTVDAYCAEEGIAAIDLLKIDTQGNDLRVLRGARAMLAARRISVVACEAHFAPMYDGQPTLPELLAEMGQYAYAFMGLYDMQYWDNRLVSGNVLWVREQTGNPEANTAPR